MLLVNSDFNTGNLRTVITFKLKIENKPPMSGRMHRYQNSDKSLTFVRTLRCVYILDSDFEVRSQTIIYFSSKWTDREFYFVCLTQFF